MQVIDEGHKYKLLTLDGELDQKLTFVKRNKPQEKFPFNSNSYPGTTLQDTMRCQIDRLKYLTNQAVEMNDLESVSDNTRIITGIREHILILEQRAARRHGRELFLSVEEIQTIETLSYCTECGHIGCKGNCHV